VGLTTLAIVILSLWVVLIVAAGLVMALRPGGAGVKLAPMGEVRPVDATGERQEIPLGGEAQVLGNPRGRVQGVYLRPDSRRVDAIQLGGGLLEGEAIPIEAVVAADGETVSLSDGWQDGLFEPDKATALLRDNMSVVSVEGKRLGRLHVVCCAASSWQATAIVLSGRVQPSLRLVPIDRVVEVGPDRLLTSVRKADSDGLQAYASDWELRQAILDRLSSDPELGGLQRGLDVEVKDQRVRLDGYVADQAQVDRVEEAVRNTPGVLAFDSRLKTDEQLVREVKEALARDPSTASADLRVSARSGVVDISGEAADRATVRRIDAVTREMDGVLVLHNMVSVRVAQRA
jgi:osmotically-inducible protein OsmY